RVSPISRISPISRVSRISPISPISQVSRVSRVSPISRTSRISPVSPSTTSPAHTAPPPFMSRNRRREVRSRERHARGATAGESAAAPRASEALGGLGPASDAAPGAGLTAKVLTVSDGVVHGTREDRSGVALVDRLTADGYEVAEHRVVPDGVQPVATAL